MSSLYLKPLQFALSLLPIVVFAQADESQQKILQQRAQAVAMIEQTASDALLWDNHKSAVEALALAADVLWKESPTRSARWLTRAWELIEKVPEGEQDARLREFMRASQKSPLRSLVLRIARTHDPALADSFIEQLTKTQPEERKDRGAFDDRTARGEQFLRLAREAVDRDPELAFALAQRSLADGVSFTLQNVLTSLRKKDVALSNRLFDLALASFANRVPDPSEAEVLAGYLFQPGITFSSNSAGQVIMSMNPQQRNESPVAQSEPQRAQSFLVAAYQAFLTRPLSLDTPAARSRAQQIWVFGTRNVARYESVAPEFFVPAKTYLVQLEQQLFPEGRGDPFPRNPAASRDSPRPDEQDAYEARIKLLEDRADRTSDPASKRLAYVEAVLATSAQDYPRAKQIAEKIADDIVRAETIAFVYYRAALSYVAQKELDKASSLIVRIDDAQRRSMVRIAIAQNLLSTGFDTQVGPDEAKIAELRAVDMLTEIERDLRKESHSANGARIMIGRAALISKVDRQQTLFALQQALQVINKLEHFELNEPTAPRLGISISRRSESLVGPPRVGFSFRSAIDSVVQDEFDAIAELAGSFRVREVRGLAQLEAARLFLEKQPKQPRLGSRNN